MLPSWEERSSDIPIEYSRGVCERNPSVCRTTTMRSGRRSCRSSRTWTGAPRTPRCRRSGESRLHAVEGRLLQGPPGNLHVSVMQLQLQNIKNCLITEDVFLCFCSLAESIRDIFPLAVWRLQTQVSDCPVKTVSETVLLDTFVIFKQLPSRKRPSERAGLLSLLRGFLLFFPSL